MNAQLRASLMAEAVPMAAPGKPAASCVVLTEAGWRLAWMVGLRKEAFGPSFKSAREAAAASADLNERGYAT